jgi:hypothetical protein
MQEASISRSTPLEAMSNSQERTAMSVISGTPNPDIINPFFVSPGVTPLGVLPGLGPDSITGGGGGDWLSGGLGNDTFIYNSLTDAPTGLGREVIADFDFHFFVPTEHDMIDLSAIDADAIAAGNQSFNFLHSNIGGSSTPTGDLNFDPLTHILSGNVDGWAGADFEIQLPFSVTSLALTHPGLGVDIIG